MENRKDHAEYLLGEKDTRNYIDEVEYNFALSRTKKCRP